MNILDNASFVITILNIGLALTIIFLERRNIGETWAWLMVLLFIPVAGFILYLFFGQNLSKRKLYHMNRDIRLSRGRVIDLQRDEFKTKNIRFHDVEMEEYRNMMYLNLSSSSAFFTQNNDLSIFTNGKDKFDSLLETIRRAKQHIHLMYYIIKDDNLGNLLVKTLAAKVAEGVEVRLLYDDVGSRNVSPHFFQELRKAGGQVASFFPSKIPYVNIRVNYRNHRKVAVIDGIYGYIGGFNIGDEYLGLVERFGFWRDTHLYVQGDAVLQLQTQFLLDWNQASESKLKMDDRLFPSSRANGRIGMQIVASGPNDPVEHIRNAYIKMIHSAKESIYIQTPYFIPDESVLTALKLAVLSGVDVRLMIPRNPDYRMVYWATLSYLGDLLPVGMRCYLYEKGFLHAKMIVIDGKVASVGTANVDIRSFKLNFEINAVVYDTVKASELKSIFESDLADCRELTSAQYDSRPRWLRMRESLVRLLSPIL